MKKDYTRIVILLDRSGSMGIVRDATVAGLNRFIKDQREAPGFAKVKLVQFSSGSPAMNWNLGSTNWKISREPDKLQTVDTWDGPITDVRELTLEDFVPTGGTPLFDAQGKIITELGQELASLSEDERPERVMVVILTDGEENSSSKYSHEQIATMIKHQQDVYNWNFVFLGANQDAIKTAVSFNIAPQSAMTFTSSTVGMNSTMDSLSSYTKSYRGSVSSNAAFTSTDREAALEK